MSEGFNTLDLDLVLREHKLWLEDVSMGQRADLSR